MSIVRNFNDILLVPLASSDKSHRLIQLPNGILTLLISDPAEDLASIAICVAAGAYNDPDEIPGLAHFCEHLLLLGSKNFPNPSEFHDALSKAGGKRNAFTTGDQTCFFFEVPSNSTVNITGTEEPVFNHLVKILADAINEPLFPESMFEREIYAIENEHTANKALSGRLLYHGLRLISNSDHPFHRFATGNFFTLNDLPKIKKTNVREKLKSYFNENYVSEKMTLVIRGSQSLNLLQKLAVQNFASVPTASERAQKKKIFGLGMPSKAKTDVKLADSLNEFDISAIHKFKSSPFSSSDLNNCVIINSSNNPTLRLFFPLKEIQDQSFDLFKTAWANLVGDEGSGSLDEGLKSKGYSVSLSAFSQHLARGDEVLVIELKLTNTGAKNVSDIISIILKHYKEQVFNDFNRLGNFLFEMESIDLLNYLHQDIVSSPMKETSKYAEILQQNLRVLKPKNILKRNGNWNCQSKLGRKDCEEFWLKKGEEFSKFVKKFFHLENLRFVLLGDTKLFESLTDGLRASYSKTDQFFNFDYIIGKFKPSEFSTSTNLKFRIVKSNPFLPKYALDHSLLHALLENSSKSSSKASLSLVTRSSWSSTKASLVSYDTNYEIWVKPESSKVFNSKIYLSFELIAAVSASPQNTMSCEIIADLLKLKLSHKLYASEMLNYTWEVHASLKGDVRFGFTVSGYRDGIPILLKIITQEFNKIVKEADFTKDEFRRSRVSVRARYNELIQTSSMSLAIAGLLVVLEDKVWSLEDRIEALDDMDTDEFEGFLNQFQNGQKFLRLVIQGDFDKYSIYSGIINDISGHLKSSTLVSFKEPSTHLIKPGASYHVIRESGANDPTNAICFFIQTGPRGDHFTEQFTRLLSFLMSLTLVPDLRFKKQLGYAVLGGTRILRSTIGIHITVMSGNFTCQYLETKIDEYILQWEKSFANMSEKDFRTAVVEPYLKNFKINMTASGGPESLTSEMAPSAGSSNYADAGNCMKIHRILKDEISTGTYDPQASDIIDKKWISNLTKKKFLEFFHQRLSANSSTRSQLSIMIKSSLSPEESQQQLIRLHLEAFLKMNGLRISSEKLKELVEETGGNAVYLLKDLFKYFMSQGESLKLCTIVLKEVVKQVFESVKHYKNNSGASSTLNSKSIVIKDINQFHQETPVYYIEASSN